MKRNPYRAAFAAMTLALVVACTPAADTMGDVAEATNPAATLEAAMQADRDFAAMAKAEGLKPAFLKYMHPTDSKFIQAGAVVEGAEAIAAGFDQSPPDFMVDWTPDGGQGSASGDLAVTTGLYTITMGGQAIEAGRYVTVWSRDAAGELKATIDAAVPNPPAAEPAPVQDAAPAPG